MRAKILVPVAAAFLLAGCATSSPTPPPVASPSPTPEASESPHVIDNESLPTVEEVMALLKSSGDDSGEPGVTFGALFAPGEQQFFENTAEYVPGPAAIRVACTTADGSDVAITFTVEGSDPLEFSAPCANAEDGMTIVRTEEQRVDIAGPYRFTVDTTADAAVAVGVVRLDAE